jgi:hypothetical protein
LAAGVLEDHPDGKAAGNSQNEEEHLPGRARRAVRENQEREDGERGNEEQGNGLAGMRQSLDTNV